MNMAKKAVAVMCGIMIALMSFTLTDLGNAIGGFPAYEEEKGSEKLTISEHSNKSALILDTKYESVKSSLRGSAHGSRQKMDRGMTLFFVSFFILFYIVFVKMHVLGLLKNDRRRRFWMERFLHELISQKEKDGKKRDTAAGEFF